MTDEGKSTVDRVDETPHFTDEPAPADVRAWEQIEAGRYMPRRIKGSYKGRALLPAARSGGHELSGRRQ